MYYTTILGETCSDYRGPCVYYIVEAQTDAKIYAIGRWK